MMRRMTEQSNSQSDANGLKRTADVSAAMLADMLGLWSDGADPLNEQLAAALTRAVTRGLLPPGARLPAERELAGQLGLSRTTIVSAYDRLRQSGLVRSRQGSGTRVAARRPGLAQPYDVTWSPTPRPLAGGPRSPLDPSERDDPRTSIRPAAGLVVPVVDDAVKLTIGALPASIQVRDAIDLAVREDLEPILADTGYDPYGLPSLRAAIAAHLRRLGVSTEPDQVLVTSGAQQALHLIAAQLGGPDAAVAIENPTYIGAIDAFRASGTPLLPIPVDADGGMVDVLPLLAASGRMRLAYVIPTFHNPTGATMPEGRRRTLARLADELSITVVEDLTPDFDFGLGSPPPIGAFGRADRVITIGSLSKLAWGGLRIGWIRAPRADIERLVAGKIVADHSTSLITQAIGTRVFERLDEIAAETRRTARARRDLIATHLHAKIPEWTFETPDGGLSLWVRIADADAVAFTRLALSYGVIVRPGPVASPDGGFRDHIRVAFGGPPDELVEAVDRLAAAWAAYTPSTRISRSSVAVSV
jgi:DNA-binding transcriptional MocR family regulator